MSDTRKSLSGIGLSSMETELKQQFEYLIGERSYLEHRWEDYAGWTLPFLFPHEEYYSTTEAQHDFHSLGAQALNHLSNKIAVTLFPPSRPFFKVELTPEQDQMMQEGEGFTAGDIDIFTSRAEQQAMRNAEKIKLRTAVVLSMKNLIALGNTLIYYPEDFESPAQVYNMRDYVVKRDMSGALLQIITKDRKSMETIPAEFRTQLMGKGLKEDQQIDLYTGITRTANNSFFVKQELENEIISTEGVYPEDNLPWTALTWNLMRGQDYGNGLVEEYAGDFHVISSLAQSNLNLAAIASDIKILVNPMGQTDVEALNESPAGTYVHGLPTDVAFLQLEKLNELQFTMNMLETYERRISSAFLLNTQVTRDAERVTAEEIRMNVNELEGSLGGVYSRLGEEMQQPIAKKLLQSVNKELAALNPVILTGVESLSRNTEHEQIIMYINDLAMMANIPEPMIPFVKYDDMAKVLASNRGLEYTKFVKSTEEVAAEQEEAQEDQQEAVMGEAVAEGLGQQIGLQGI